MLEGLLVPMFTAFRRDESVAYEETVAHASWLVKAGVDGLVPFGTFGEGASLSLSEKVRLTEEILGLSKKPIIAYNFPGMSLTINPDVIAGVGVWGVKDSSGSIDSAKNYLNSNIKLLIGSDVLLSEAISIGASGGICGIANFFPRRMKRINDLAKAGKLDEAKRELAPVAEFSSGIVQEGFTPGLAISAFKSAAPKLIPTSLGDMRTPAPRIETDFARWSKSLDYSEMNN